MGGGDSWRKGGGEEQEQTELVSKFSVGGITNKHPVDKVKGSSDDKSKRGSYVGYGPDFVSLELLGGRVRL